MTTVAGDEATAEWTVTLGPFPDGTDWRDHPALAEIETAVCDVAERHGVDVGTAGRLVEARDEWTEAVLDAADEVALCSAFTAPEEVTARIDALRNAMGGLPTEQSVTDLLDPFDGEDEPRA